MREHGSFEIRDALFKGQPFKIFIRQSIISILANELVSFLMSSFVLTRLRPMFLGMHEPRKGQFDFSGRLTPQSVSI